MARLEAPPFARGETFYNGATIDTANYGGLQHEGKEYWFEDIDYSNTAVGAKGTRSSKYVKARIMRNVSGAALLPKRLVTPQRAGTDGKFFLGRVDGYADTTNEARSYPVDEFLPAAGVPNGDLFWMVEEGPAMCLLPLAGAGFNAASIVVGDALAALTAITSGATTAGRVSTLSPLTSASTNTNFDFAVNAVLGMVGRALSAATSGQTNGDLLVDIGHW